MSDETLRATESFLQHPAASGDHVTMEVKTHVRVSREQAEAFKALPADLQAKLGPPVYGQVMSAAAIKDLAQNLNAKQVSSTIMCPW